MIDQRLKAETAEEIEEIQTIAGIKGRICRSRWFDPLIAQVFRLAERQNLSEEETYVLLAYHALVAKETIEKDLLNRLRLSPALPIVIG
jgi:hypothetical protein